MTNGVSELSENTAYEKSISVRVPATSANLGPGFDSLGLALALYSEFKLTLCRRPGLEFNFHGENAEDIAGDEQNVVWQAIKYLLAKAGAQDEYLGAKIEVQNNIPLSRGLGSSATAIVGGLKAANVLLGNRYNRRELLQMATEIEGHPDNVAPAILGGVTVNVIEEGQVHSLSFWPKIRLKMAVAVPDFRLATKLAREALPEKVPLKDAIFNIGHASMLTAALCRGNESYLRHALADTLHQPYRAHLIPGFDEVIKAAKEHNALGAVLSGAGPSIIAFTLEQENNAAEVAKAMQGAFAHNGIAARGLVLNLDVKGAHIVGNRNNADE